MLYFALVLGNFPIGMISFPGFTYLIAFNPLNAIFGLGVSITLRFFRLVVIIVVLWLLSYVIPSLSLLDLWFTLTNATAFVGRKWGGFS